MKKISVSRYDLGKATLKGVKKVEAGSFQTIRYTYVAGHPIDDTGCLKIVFRYAGDFGTPQFDDPQAPNFCTVSTTGDCRIEPRWDVKGHTRPWGKALYLKVMGGYLDKGETIDVVFGECSAGSPGWQVQTFVEATFEFRTFIDPIASYQFKELPRSPVMGIVAGKPHKAVCIAPSQVTQGQAFAYHLKVEDRWGNPVRKPQTVKHRSFSCVGIEYVSAKDARTGLKADSNPIRIVDASKKENVYWADFHGQSEETIGSNSLVDYLSFARDYGLLDISGHQGNDFQVTDAFWKEIKQQSDAFNESGRFVVFPGYEWSGNTPLGGDRNIYFAGRGGAITRSSNELLPDGESVYPVSETADRLFARLKGQAAAKAFAFAHVGGRYADMNMHDPDIEVAMEIHSAWGTFEWLLEDALALGYRVGVCANSDGHKGRPGASYPGASRFGSYGGLTCVLADKLDRESIYQAVKARHTYGTTGNRCLVDVSVDTADGQHAIMGDVVMAGEETPRLSVHVVGTAPVENVEVRNGADVLKTVRPYGRGDLGRRIKLIWSGAEVRGRARKVCWDGRLKVTGNSIERVEPVNFWNPDKPLRHTSRSTVEWESITTGGLAGCIITLAKADRGKLSIETAQGNVSHKVTNIGLRPRIRRYGGVKKQVEITRLPDQLSTRELAFELPLKSLHKGDNPITIRLLQEDGHMAWTSPVYLVK